MDTSTLAIVSLDATATAQLTILDTDSDLVTYDLGVIAALLSFVVIILCAIAVILGTSKGGK